MSRVYMSKQPVYKLLLCICPELALKFIPIDTQEELMCPAEECLAISWPWTTKVLP